MSLEGHASAGQELIGSINTLSVLTLSAYGLAVKYGFKGTEKEWLASLTANKDTIEQAVIDYLIKNPTQVDNTLTQKGMAADAKATGDAIRDLENVVGIIVNTVINNHVNAKDNPHNVTAHQLGLGNVDNTSDRNKPVSYAQSAAINEVRDIAVEAQRTGNNALLRSGGKMDGDINMNGKRITGLPTPTQSTDIVTVGYLDEYFLGGEW